MIIQEWRSRKSDIIFYLIVWIPLVVLAGWSYAKGTADDGCGFVFLVGIIFLIGNEALFSVIEREHKYMVVWTTKGTPSQIVEKVLEAKGIPYFNYENDYFLDDGNIKIQISRRRIGIKALFFKRMRSIMRRQIAMKHLFTKGDRISVSIGPVNKKNKQLVENLQKRIRDGFNLAGLA